MSSSIGSKDLHSAMAGGSTVLNAPTFALNAPTSSNISSSAHAPVQPVGASRSEVGEGSGELIGECIGVDWSEAGGERVGSSEVGSESKERACVRMCWNLKLFALKHRLHIGQYRLPGLSLWPPAFLAPE